MSDQNQVTAADARTFLTNFGHSEDALKGMADDAVVQLHGTVSGFHSKAVTDAVTKAKGEAPVFSDSWRQHIAGEDKEALKTLERFADPGAMFKSYSELRAKLSKGELKANVPFPDKGTPEEQAAWRKEMGVPDKPEAYDTTLANGVVIGEEDKPLVGEFLKFAHANHTPPEAVKKTLEWFLGDYREGVEQKAAEAKAERKRAAEDTLRKDWGADYRPNINAIDNMLAANVSSNPELLQRIKNSIEIEPEFAKLFANLARLINPVSTLTGIDNTRMEQSINEEIGKIEEYMKTNRAAYNKDEAKQARLRELYDARERLKGRQTVS